MKKWVAEGKGDPSKHISRQGQRKKDGQKETVHVGVAEDGSGTSSTHFSKNFYGKFQAHTKVNRLV